MASIDLDCPPFNRQSSDLNGSLPTEVPVNTEPQPVPESNGTQVAIHGTSNGLDMIRAQSEDLASFEELLRGAWSAPGPTSLCSKEICLREKSAGAEGYIAQNDWNEALYPGSRRGMSIETPILLDDHPLEDKDAQDPGREDSSSSKVHGQDGSTLEEHERKHSGERAEEEGLWSVPAPSNSDVRQSALFEKTQSSSSDAPPPPSTLLPPPANTVLTSISDLQTEPSDGGLKDIGLRLSDEGKEMADTGNGHNGDGDGQDEDRTAKGATGVTGIRDSAKRTADNAYLNEGGEGVPRSEKVRCIDPIDGIDDTDEIMSDLEFARLRSLPTPVFRMPPSWRDFQQCENTISSSRSSGAGDSQDDPLVIDDDGGKTGGSGASTKATSAELETGTAYLSSLWREDFKTFGSSNAPITPNLPVESLDRPTYPDIALPQHLVQTDDKAEKEEGNTEPDLAPSRGRSRDPAFGRAETHKLGYAAASEQSTKRDRQALRSDSSNVIPHTDYNGTDDDDDIRPLLQKRTSRYPSGWPHDWEKSTTPGRGEAGDSHGKPFVVQGEEPDTLAERIPPQTDDIISKSGHADTPAGHITPAPSLKGATDDQPHPIAPPPRPKRASGQRKPAHLESQQWEIRKIIGKRRTRRGCEYNVVWAKSWLPKSELGNAQRLVREFELKDSIEQKSRRGRRAQDGSSVG